MRLDSARAGLTTALELLKDLAEKHEHVSYADMFQLASGLAVEVRGQNMLLSVAITYLHLRLYYFMGQHSF